MDANGIKCLKDHFQNPAWPHLPPDSRCVCKDGNRKVKPKDWVTTLPDSRPVSGSSSIMDNLILAARPVFSSVLSIRNTLAV